uniref:Shikimate dehydrogenase (NADP(+)) n=1 Tax=Candidatus Caldatribacterium californiense TaxID=1454726 RepID=A0A7V3YKM3_9BACT
MISASTKLLALIGHPVAHSLSPVFQNAALQHLRLPFVYLAFDIPEDRLEEAVRAFRVLGVSGFNVTVPYKEAICPFLDALEGEAELLRSVNAVVERQGKFLGYNTDVYGFEKSLEEEGVEVRGRTFLLFGAGGTARSVLFVLAKRGAGKVLITNRTKSRAEALARWGKEALGLSCEVLEWMGDQGLCGGTVLRLRSVSGIINATALGLSGEVPPVPWEFLPSLEVVCDVVYHREGTPLVQEAKKRGLKSFDGKRMLLHQGARSFFLFTGVPAPLPVMEEALSGG